MKKLFLAFVLCFGLSQALSAQIQFGLKGGVNYNSDSFENVKDDVLNGAESRTGFHAGLWFRGKLPIIGLYLRPEIVYTQLNSDVVYANSINNQSVSTDYKFSKIDVPVLLGTKIFGIGNIFAGPSFQYILASDFGLNDLSEVSTEDFSVGLQFGAGIEFGKLGLEVRWERNFNDNETVFIDDSLGTQVNFDTRVNQIIIGLAYRL